MESAQIIPINRTKPFMQLAFPKKQETTEMLHPGKVTTIAPEIRMGIAYDKVNDEYIPRFKFWHNETPLKQLYPNDRRQLDLRTSCQRVITVVATRHDPDTGRPVKTWVVIEEATL